MSRQRNRSRADDSGSALVLALIVVTFVGLTLAAVLEFTGTGVALSGKIRNDRNENHYVSGAVDAAISNIRGSSTKGRYGLPCPTLSMPEPPAHALGAAGHSFTVDCTPLDTGSASLADSPDYAIHAVGTGAADGIHDVAGNYLLTVDAGIFSAGDITVGGGGSRQSMHVIGTVQARRGCTGPITTTDTALDCTYSGPTAPGSWGSDPGYPAAVTDGADLAALIATNGADPAPTCTSYGADFSPGYYSVSPPVLLAGTTGCSGSVWRFTPGSYYFDYSGSWNTASPRRKVVGGMAGSGFLSASLGESCDVSAAGVQFNFGGESRLEVQGSSSGLQGMELCAPDPALVPATKQLISLYGSRSGPPSATAGSGPLSAEVAPTNAGSVDFLPETASGEVPFAQQIDTTSAAAAAVPRGGTAAAYYSQFADVPPGSKITSASLQLRVAHTITGGTAKVMLTTLSGSREVSLPATCVPDCTVSIPLSDVAGAIPWRDLNSLTARYVATGPSAASAPPAAATLNGLAVDVTWTEPTVRPLTCGVTCDFLVMDSNPRMTLHGTAYTPTARLNVMVHNSGLTVFRRGVIAKNIDITVSSSTTQTVSPFQLPGATPFGRKVLFVGRVDGIERVRACAFYRDVVGTGHARRSSAGYGLAVPRWTDLRQPGATACP